MFPLYDESYYSRKRPLISIFLILVNIVVFLYFYFGGRLEEVIFNYGVMPNQILAGHNLTTLVSSVFIHAGFSHLIGNMWFLWVFGDNVENKIGKIKYIVFYLIVGILAAYIHSLTVPIDQKNLPMVGASGAISGILGAYLVLFPKNRIRAFWLFFFQPIFFYVPAFVYILVWFLYQILYIGSYTPIAYMAHIGGFLAGMVLILPFKKSKVV